MYVSSSWASLVGCGFDTGTHVRTADPTAGMMRVGQVEGQGTGHREGSEKAKRAWNRVVVAGSLVGFD